MSKASGISRRTLCLMLPALAASAAGAEDKYPLHSKVYKFQDLPVQTSGRFSARPVLEGWTHQAYRISLHESYLAPGAAPHPPHRHRHEEVFMIREGALEVTIAGKSSTLGPGDVAYVASMEEHGVRTAGSGDAKYFVFELGTDK